MTISKVRKASIAIAMTAILAGASFPASAAPDAKAAAADTLPLLINPDGLHWVKTIPEAGDKSPEYAILRSDPIPS